MKLERALELCQLPLDQSRSHIVRVDRYALVHTLADRAEFVKDNASLKGVISRHEDTIRKMEKQMEESEAKLEKITIELVDAKKKKSA